MLVQVPASPSLSGLFSSITHAVTGAVKGAAGAVESAASTVGGIAAKTAISTISIPTQVGLAIGQQVLGAVAPIAAGVGNVAVGAIGTVTQVAQPLVAATGRAAGTLSSAALVPLATSIQTAKDAAATNLAAAAAPPPASTSSNLPLYLGLGAGAVLLFAIMGRRGRRE